MKVKSLALAVGALGVLTAAAWFFTRDTGGPAVDARLGQPLLDSATIAKTAEFFLRSGGAEVTLTGVDPAGFKAGTVKEYHGMTADYAKFARAIEDLTKSEAKISRLVGTTAERIEKLGFAGDRIELRGQDGTALWTLHLGSSPEKGGRFVKFGDESKAYLSGFNGWLDGTPKNWADAALIGAKSEDVVGIEVRLPAGGTLTATRVDGKGVWKCQDLADGETLKDSEWTSLAGKLAGLRFMDTRDPEPLETIAARPTARSYVITLADGRRFTITASQRQDPQPEPPAPAVEGATPPAPQPQPADIFVVSSRADDPVNALMARRSFQVAEWTFTSLPTTREALINPAPAPAPAATPVPDAAAAEAAPAADVPAAPAP